MPENWLRRMLTRLLLTGIGQILLITLWMQFPGQEAAGYLFLLILFAIPVGTISNWIIKVLIIKVIGHTRSKLIKSIIPFIIIAIITYVLYLLLLVSTHNLIYITTLYAILSLPLLLLEMLIIVFKLNKGNRDGNKRNI